MCNANNRRQNPEEEDEEEDDKEEDDEETHKGRTNEKPSKKHVKPMGAKKKNLRTCNQTQKL